MVKYKGSPDVAFEYDSTRDYGFELVNLGARRVR
jgi:hypothetical protein